MIWQLVAVVQKVNDRVDFTLRELRTEFDLSKENMTVYTFLKKFDPVYGFELRGLGYIR